MPINGTEFFNDPFNTTFSPFTNLFDSLVSGVDTGSLFFLFPVIILTFGIYIKTKSYQNATLFMVGSGVLLASGGLFTGSTTMAVVFTIFTALGFTGLFLSIYFDRGGT